MGIDVLAAKAVTEREEEGTAVHIKDAAGEPMFNDDDSPFTITVVGSYSATYRRAEAREIDRVLRRRSSAKPSAELVQGRRLALAAAACTAWHECTKGDQPFPFSQENAVALFEAAPWILAQVEEARDDHSGFSERPSET